MSDGNYGDSRPFPLVDFISRWRQRGRSGGGSRSPSTARGSLSSTAAAAAHCDTTGGIEGGEGRGIYPAAAATAAAPTRSRSNHADFEPDSPLLRKTDDYYSPSIEEDVPYPYPTTFLPDPLLAAAAAQHAESAGVQSTSTCELSSDDEDSQSIRSYDLERIDQFDRSQKNKRKKRPTLLHGGEDHGGGSSTTSNKNIASSQNPFPLLSKVPGDVELNGTTMGQKSDSRKHIPSETYIEMARCVVVLMLISIFNANEEAFGHLLARP